MGNVSIVVQPYAAPHSQPSQLFGWRRLGQWSAMAWRATMQPAANEPGSGRQLVSSRLQYVAIDRDASDTF